MKIADYFIPFIFTVCIIVGLSLIVTCSPTTKTGNVTNIVGNNLTLQFQNTNSQKIPQCTVSATESCYPKSTYTIQVENPQDYTLNQSIEVYYYKSMDSSNVYLTPVYRSYLILGSIIFAIPFLICFLIGFSVFFVPKIRNFCISSLQSLRGQEHEN